MKNKRKWTERLMLVLGVLAVVGVIFLAGNYQLEKIGNAQAASADADTNVKADAEQADAQADPTAEATSEVIWNLGSTSVGWETENRHDTQVCTGPDWDPADLVETNFADMAEAGVEYQGLWPGAAHQSGLFITGEANESQGFFTGWATVTAVAFWDDERLNVAYFSTQYDPDNLEEIIWKSTLGEMLETINTITGTTISVEDVEFVFQVPWDNCEFDRKTDWELVFTSIRNRVGITPTPFKQIYSQFQMPGVLVVTEIVQ